MHVMDDEATDTVISIRELQRNAADVMSRVERGCSFRISRHGRTVGRLIPPDPAEEAIRRAVAKGILDPEALAKAPTAAEVARITPEPTEPGERPLSEVLAELRRDER
jgi:prevent-host-death family protein